MRAWFAEKRTRPRWRFAGGFALMALALAALTIPGSLARALLVVAAMLVLYVGIVVCLRASGLLVTDHTIPRLHKREVAGVLAAVLAAGALTAFVAVGIVANNTTQPSANPSNQGCNGYVELCPQPLNQIVWPASHNAMSSAAYDFLGAEHTITIPEQLNAGVRFLMIDAYYGYDDKGLVRTNLAGGVNRDQLRQERGDEAVHELDRLGALTGVADTSGKKQDIYFCHDFCELGAIPSMQVFNDIDVLLLARRVGHAGERAQAVELVHRLVAPLLAQLVAVHAAGEVGAHEAVVVVAVVGVDHQEPDPGVELLGDGHRSARRRGSRTPPTPSRCGSPATRSG